MTHTPGPGFAAHLSALIYAAGAVQPLADYRGNFETAHHYRLSDGPRDEARALLARLEG